MPEERKLVTVLFADIVGSTEMGLSHDPEVVRASLGEAFESASEILRAHGGTVEKFIGDAIMAVFGVPAAHDDDPDRAVRAAFALRDKITGARDVDAPALRVRIGINTGEAVAGSGETAQFLVTGAAVNAAARLQQAAAPGEIVVGHLTKRLTAGGVTYGAAREVEAKGIGKIAAWPAESVIGDVPEQHRGLPGLHAPLIGRDHELRTLVQAYERVAKDGRPHLLTVYGPAGAGKSRLTAEFFDAIGSDRVRGGRCLPYGEGITYYAVQLIVRADAGIGIADPRDVAIEKIRSAAREAFGDDVEDADSVAKRVSVLAGIERADEALPEVRPDQLREELAFGLRRYLERRAASAPLVLVFEDVHWAEPGLLDLIEDLAEWSRAPLLLLCLARPDFRELRPAWGSAAANATAVTLSPLGSDDTRRLIAELLAIDDLPEQVRSDVVTRAEGNPLYVEEFLRMLMESGRIEKRDGRWVADASITTVEVPPTLQGLIAARLDRVAPDVKALLQRASLAGRLFSTDALAALGDGAAPDAELLRDAIRRDLLVEADERALGSGRVFRFKHVLIRDVAYSTVPKAERSRLHDRYGRWLETSLGDRRHEIADIVAFHAEQAFLLARELRPSAAADLGRRGLDLLLEAARSAYNRIDVHAALNLYQRARVVGEVITATGVENAEIAGRIVLGRDLLATSRPAVAEVDAAIDVAKTAAPNKVLPELLLLRARLTQDEAGPERVRPVLDEALEAARQAGDPDLIADVMWARAFDRYYAAEIDEMRRLLEEAHEHVKRSGSKRAGAILYWLGKTALYQGDLTATASFVEEAIAALPYKSKHFRAIDHYARAGRADGQGDYATGVGEARIANALFRELGEPGFIALTAWEMGEAMIELGDDAGARDVLAEAVDLFTRRGQRGQIPEVEARLARALVHLGDRAAARAHAEAARAIAMPSDLESRFIAAVAVAEVREADGDLAAADALFREAVATMEPSGMGDGLAETREHYGRFLLRHGRADDARAQLDKARAFWSDPLAGRHRDRIDALLAATGPRTMSI
ncbi:MAG TPA: adenylate/guanylate cyclase domain-containing protein [Candidatus Limnocylindria bacterium]|nr:adenylate/guanylate cyclase domain-containing protein [Candidatus Limnocylindria bacterium]